VPQGKPIYDGITVSQLKHGSERVRMKVDIELLRLLLTSLAGRYSYNNYLNYNSWKPPKFSNLHREQCSAERSHLANRPNLYNVSTIMCPLKILLVQRANLHLLSLL